MDALRRRGAGEMGIGALIIAIAIIITSALVGDVIFNVLHAYSNESNAVAESSYSYAMGDISVSKVYGIVGSKNGVAGLLITGRLMPRVDLFDLRFLHISLKLNDEVRWYTLSQNVSTNDDYYSALSKANANHYAVYVFKSSASPWDPSNGSYLISPEDILNFVVLRDKLIQKYEFYLPFVTTTTGPSDTDNFVNFIVYQDSTVINIDTNNDGIPDVTLSGNRGDILHWGGHTPSEFPVVGAHIWANHPVNAYYKYVMSDWGAYEDGEYQYELQNVREWGKEYYIPIRQSFTAIVASYDRTLVQVDTNNDGTAEYTQTLNKGQTWVLNNLPAGTHIFATDRINVVEINTKDSTYYGNTSAFTLLPVDGLESQYFVPKEEGYNYENAVDYTKVYLLGIYDDTRVFVDENRDGTPDFSFILNRGQQARYSHPATDARIYSSKPFYAVYRFDVYARDPWIDVYRHYTYAFSLIGSKHQTSDIVLWINGDSSWHVKPGNSFDLVNFVLMGDNTVSVDYGMDGSADRTDYLHAGDLAYYGPNYSGSSISEIKSTSGGAVYKSSIGWWDQRSEGAGARTILYSSQGSFSGDEKILIHSGEYAKLYMKNTYTSSLTSVNFEVPYSFESGESLALLYSSGM